MSTQTSPQQISAANPHDDKCFCHYIRHPIATILVFLRSAVMFLVRLLTGQAVLDRPEQELKSPFQEHVIFDPVDPHFDPRKVVYDPRPQSGLQSLSDKERKLVSLWQNREELNVLFITTTVKLDPRNGQIREIDISKLLPEMPLKELLNSHWLIRRDGSTSDSLAIQDNDEDHATAHYNTIPEAKIKDILEETFDFHSKKPGQICFIANRLPSVLRVFEEHIFIVPHWTILFDAEDIQRGLYRNKPHENGTGSTPDHDEMETTRKCALTHMDSASIMHQIGDME